MSVTIEFRIEKDILGEQDPDPEAFTSWMK
jgi:hypothetical protein